MDWLLILTLSLNGQTRSATVGQMDSRESCAIAGAGMAEIMQREMPGLTVAFACVKGAKA